MPKAFALMKAMPPTTGHLQLIQFAQSLCNPGHPTVIIDTLPDEPMIEERLAALKRAAPRVFFKHVSQDIKLGPHDVGFDTLWQGIMLGAGARPGDYLVTSEKYGKWLARMTEMTWMPYDIARDMNPARATKIRDDFMANWEFILPEFRPYLQTRVTIFGAESTGKTTLAKMLATATHLNAKWRPEWARPYLENDENVVNVRTMTNIWHGQGALQRQQFLDTPILIYDTDLFSTAGYWQYWSNHCDSYKPFSRPRIDKWLPDELIKEARELASDLYLLPQSNIPFEPDPLRYGGNEREIPDHWWANFLARMSSTGNRLDYHVLKGEFRTDRMDEAEKLIRAKVAEKQKMISYTREDS